MIVRVESDPPTIRPGMWLMDRDGKRWQWSEYDGYGVLTDGKGMFRLLYGSNRMWRRGEMADDIACGELTPEADAATVEVGTLPINTVIRWGDHCWQIVQKISNVTVATTHWIGVRMRPWPNTRAGVAESTTIHRTTPVTPLGVPVVEDAKECDK